MEKLERTGKWYKYIETPPYLNKLVIVFRNKNKKYIFAECQMLKDDYGKEQEEWVTQHGQAHAIEHEDKWMGFTHASELVVYENK